MMAVVAGARLRGFVSSALAMLALLALTGCSDESPAPVRPPADAGIEADVVLEAGPDAGPVPGACAPGESEQDDGSCRAAGIPAELCGEGFAPTGDGSCDPVLPAGSCEAGRMAIPGQTECRPVAPCGGNRWGEAPVDATTQYVDGSYAGGNSDGTETAPWTTIQEAVDAAPADAVVAIAAGTYGGDVVVRDKPVRLWGKCPAEVEIVGSDYPHATVYVNGAEGTEVHDLAITGPSSGVAVQDAVDVLFDRVWIHDTERSGATIRYSGEPTRATLSRSLVERATYYGAQVENGAELIVDRSVLREGVAHSGDWGLGIYVTSYDESDPKSRVEVRRSVLSDNLEVGIHAQGSDLRVADSVVRATGPNEWAQVDGMGILVSQPFDATTVSTFDLERSVIEQSHTCGVCVMNAHTSVVATAIRDTRPQAADDLGGDGLLVGSDLSTAEERPTVAILSSTIEQGRRIGIGLSGVDARVEGTLVRDIQSELATGVHGRGLVAEVSPQAGVRASLSCTGSVVERSQEVGLLVLGSEAALSGVAIVDTRPRASDQRFGRGLIVQFSAETLDRSDVTLDHSAIRDSHDAALFVIGADLSVTDTVIEGTKPQPEGSLFGDGVIAMSYPAGGQTMTATVGMERCSVSNNARAGIAGFGATMALSASALDCNSFDLAGEPYDGLPFDISDRGGNVCGCGSETRPCVVRSSSLTPPAPVP